MPRLPPPTTESPPGCARARPAGFRLAEFRRLSGEIIGILSKSPGIRAEFRAFFRRRVRRKKLLLRGKCVRAHQSADWWARTRADRAASLHCPRLRRGQGTLLALKWRRAISGQTSSRPFQARPFIPVFLRTWRSIRRPPPRLMSSAMGQLHHMLSSTPVMLMSQATGTSTTSWRAMLI